MFGKPKNNKATRHIFVGNCGPGVGVNGCSIRSFFQKFGATAVTFPDSPENVSHVFVSFDSVEDAKQVLQTVSGKAWKELGNRALVIKYAEVREAKVREV
jgi:hypothetical protein